VGMPVLVIDAKRKWMVENSPAFAGKILLNPAEGVYVLDAADLKVARALLRSAGINHFGEAAPSRSSVRVPPDPELRYASGPLPVSRLSSADFAQTAADAAPARGASPGGRPERTKALLERLAALSLPEDRKTILEERIRSGVILRESQFSNPQSRFERREAKGMDFLGKVRLLEQIKSRPQDSAEILYRDSKGESRRRFVKPESVSRRGEAMVLEAKDRVSGEAVSLPVERLSLVRRIKGSMFG
jgi:hypothetical protein